MGLWNPGTLDITLGDLAQLMHIARRDYNPQSDYMREEHPGTTRTFVINELIPHKESECHVLCEFTYNSCGHRAGFGLRTSDRKWICFYD